MRPFESYCQGLFGLATLCPFSMGKVAEETKEVKAKNQDFSKKALPSLGGGAPNQRDESMRGC